MKTLVIILAIGILNIQFVYADSKGHMQHPDLNGVMSGELSAGSVDTEGEQINVNVFGLVCDFCAQAIEKVFMEREEVSGIKVNLSDGLIIIFTKKDKILDDMTLSKLIVDAGYNVDNISRLTL